MLKARFSTFVSIVVVSGLLIGAYFYFSNKGAVEVENPIDIFSASTSTVESSTNTVVPREERKLLAGQREYKVAL